MRNMGGAMFVTAALIFATSVVVFGAAVVDAIRVEEVDALSDPGDQSPVGGEAERERPPGGEGVDQNGPGRTGENPGRSVRVAGAPQGSLRGMVYPQVTNDEILGAVNQDLFQPDRTPSVDRYLFPSERTAATTNSRNNRRSREPSLRIVGTAIAGDLALALVQPEDSIPFAVLLGETVDGYTLVAITEESVTLVSEDQEFTFPVVEPQRGRSSDSQGRNDRNRAVAEDAARALIERAQQMLQGGQQRGQMRGGTTFQEMPVFRIQVPGGAQNPAAGAARVIRGGGAGGTAVTVVRPGGGGTGGGGGGLT